MNSVFVARVLLPNQSVSSFPVINVNTPPLNQHFLLTAPQPTKFKFNHLSADPNQGPTKSSGDNARSICRFSHPDLRRVESIF